MAFLLVASVLLVPLHSVAHAVTPAAALGASACQIMADDCCVDTTGQQPDQCPGNNAGDCCDSEECGQEATEPPFTCDVKVDFSVTQLFPAGSLSHIPTVYLAIVVPPEQ